MPFPISPIVDQSYSINGILYKWNGFAWDVVVGTDGVDATNFPVTPPSGYTATSLQGIIDEFASSSSTDGSQTDIEIATNVTAIANNLTSSTANASSVANNLASIISNDTDIASNLTRVLALEKKPQYSYSIDTISLIRNVWLKVTLHTPIFEYGMSSFSSGDFTCNASEAGIWIVKLNVTSQATKKFNCQIKVNGTVVSGAWAFDGNPFTGASLSDIVKLLANDIVTFEIRAKRNGQVAPSPIVPSSISLIRVSE